MSAACGTQVISDGRRLVEEREYQKGPGACSALLIRGGTAVVSQRDFRTLGLIVRKLDPKAKIDTSAIDHHESDWYIKYFARSWSQPNYPTSLTGMASLALSAWTPRSWSGTTRTAPFVEALSESGPGQRLSGVLHQISRTVVDWVSECPCALSERQIGRGSSCTCADQTAP